MNFVQGYFKILLSNISPTNGGMFTKSRKKVLTYMYYIYILGYLIKNVIFGLLKAKCITKTINEMVLSHK